MNPCDMNKSGGETTRCYENGPVDMKELESHLSCTSEGNHLKKLRPDASACTALTASLSGKESSDSLALS